MYLSVIHCDEKFEGLVYYPTTLGNHRASVKCIDHAISIEPDFSVWCGSDGQWSTAQNPQCQCIDGYRVSLQEERAFCEGIYYDLNSNLLFINPLYISVSRPLLLFLSSSFPRL